MGECSAMSHHQSKRVKPNMNTPERACTAINDAEMQMDATELNPVLMCFVILVCSLCILGCS